MLTKRSLSEVLRSQAERGGLLDFARAERVKRVGVLTRIGAGVGLSLFDDHFFSPGGAVHAGVR